LNTADLTNHDIVIVSLNTKKTGGLDFKPIQGKTINLFIYFTIEEDKNMHLCRKPPFFLAFLR